MGGGGGVRVLPPWDEKNKHVFRDIVKNRMGDGCAKNIFNMVINSAEIV